MRYFAMLLCLVAIAPFAGYEAVSAQEDKVKPCTNPEGTDCCCIPAHAVPPEGCRIKCTDKGIQCSGTAKGHHVNGKCYTGKSGDQCASGDNRVLVTTHEFTCIKQLCTLPNGQQGNECAWAQGEEWQTGRILTCTGHLCS